MANKKITGLTALGAGAASGDDLIVIVDDVSGTPTTKKMTVANFFDDVPVPIIIDNTATEALLVRKSGDTGNVFAVDTSNKLTLNAGLLVLSERSELTIAGGVVTAVRSFHTIDTQDNDPTDELNTINGSVSGALLILQSADSARDTTVKDAVGNIQLAGGDFTFTNVQDRLMLIGDGSNWYEISRANNA
jgi:hypothetical protein